MSKRKKQSPARRGAVPLSIDDQSPTETAAEFEPATEPEPETEPGPAPWSPHPLATEVLVRLASTMAIDENQVIEAMALYMSREIRVFSLNGIAARLRHARKGHGLR